MPYFLSAGARLIQSFWWQMFRVTWEKDGKTRQPGVKSGRRVCASTHKTLITCWVVHSILESCFYVWKWMKSSLRTDFRRYSACVFCMLEFHACWMGSLEILFDTLKKTASELTDLEFHICAFYIPYSFELVLEWYKHTVTVLHNCEIVAVGSKLCLFFIQKLHTFFMENLFSCALVNEVCASSALSLP